MRKRFNMLKTWVFTFISKDFSWLCVSFDGLICLKIYVWFTRVILRSQLEVRRQQHQPKNYCFQVKLCKICKIYLKKLFLQNVLVFIDLFYRYYLRYFIYSDCMQRHVCTTCNSITFRWSTEKKLFFL